MYPESNASGNHRVAIVIPRGADDERWINFAGRKLAERFGAAHGAAGIAGIEVGGVTELMPVVIVSAEVLGPLTELDLTIVYGIGQQVYEGLKREGVAVLIDGDAFIF
jgi:hypothetical protein